MGFLSSKVKCRERAARTVLLACPILCPRRAGGVAQLQTSAVRGDQVSALGGGVHAWCRVVLDKERGEATRKMCLSAVMLRLFPEASPTHPSMCRYIHQ